MKYRVKVSYPGVKAGTVFYPVKNQHGEMMYSTNPPYYGTAYHTLQDWIMKDTNYFEPIHERLTSEEEDEAARRYMWVPKRGSNVTFLDSALRHRLHNWSGSMSDWYWFRCGMIFRYLDEAERAAELMKNGRI